RRQPARAEPATVHVLAGAAPRIDAHAAESALAGAGPAPVLRLGPLVGRTTTARGSRGAGTGTRAPGLGPRQRGRPRLLSRPVQRRAARAPARRIERAGRDRTIQSRQR